MGVLMWWLELYVLIIFCFYCGMMLFVKFCSVEIVRDVGMVLVFFVFDLLNWIGICCLIVDWYVYWNGKFFVLLWNIELLWCFFIGLVWLRKFWIFMLFLCLIIWCSGYRRFNIVILILLLWFVWICLDRVSWLIWFWLVMGYCLCCLLVCCIWMNWLVVFWLIIWLIVCVVIWCCGSFCFIVGILLRWLNWMFFDLMRVGF